MLKTAAHFTMAENQVNANGSMFCHAMGLPQLTVADRASVPLADGRQNTIQDARTGQKFRKKQARRTPAKAPETK